MKGRFYNGITSRPFEVEVNLVKGVVSIKSIDKVDAIDYGWPTDQISTDNFSTSDRVLLSFGDFPKQSLEIQGSEAQEIMKFVLKGENKVKSIQHRITQGNPTNVAILSIVVLVVSVLLYVLYVSPFIGERAVYLFSKSSEEHLGAGIFKSMQPALDIDTLKSRDLQAFYEACEFESEYNVKLFYADQDQVNAFALPGGHIVVFRGLVEQTQCWDELAALLAHELAHVNQRHSFKQIARSVSGYLVISVLSGDVAGASSILLEQAIQINSWSNSRKFEKEADLVGLQYLKDQKIRRSSMIDLMNILLGIGESSEAYDAIEFFSTHPLTSNRIEYLEQTIEAQNNEETTTSRPLAEFYWRSLME